MALTPNSIFTLFILLSVAGYGACKDEFFKEVPKELRCSGCDLTVKVLNQMLQTAKKDEMDKHVEIAIRTMCDEKRYAITEYKAETMVKVCKFMKHYHLPELKQELLRYYKAPKRSSYVDLSQRICLNIMKLCPGIMSGDDHHFDKFKKFMVENGHEEKIAKLPNPIRVEQSHDEL